MKWVEYRHVWRSEKPILPGVWKHRDSPGHVIKGEAKDPRTGKTKYVFKVLQSADKLTAAKYLQDLLLDIRNGVDRAPTAKIRFKEYAASLYEARVANGKIKSASTRESWERVLTKRLFKAPFANMYVDVIRRADIEDWLEKSIGPQIASGKISPNTANDWLKFLRTITTAFVGKYELDRNPMSGIEDFDTRGCRQFTIEQPNSLLPEELRLFLPELKDRFPQHYAYSYLGFITGLRPSSMRPLRVEHDVNWDEGTLIIRRSQTRGAEVMDLTKTDKDQRIGLPLEILDVLKWHVSRLTRKQRATGLLFPSRYPQPRKGAERSPYMARSSLTKPFKEVTEALGMTKIITAKGMRRTSVDMQRMALLDKKMRMVISGHVTEAAQKLYETVSPAESRAAVAKVIDFLAYKKATGSAETRGNEATGEATG